MKINEIILENRVTFAKEDIEALISEIEQNCSDALSAMKGNGFLLRGTQSKVLAYKDHSPMNRKPKDTSESNQEIIDRLLSIAGFTALRGNSIFTTSDHYMASDYGNLYFIFPVNGASYTWNENIVDLHSNVFDSTTAPSMSEFLSGRLKGTPISQDPENQALVRKIQEAREVIHTPHDELEKFLYGYIHIDYLIRYPNKATVKSLNLTSWNRRIDELKAMDISSLTSNEKNAVAVIIDCMEKIASNHIRDKQATSVEHILADYEQNPQKAIEVCSKLGFINGDLKEAIESEHEICVNGEYYAILHTPKTQELLFNNFGISMKNN